MEANYYSMDEDDSYIEIELDASSLPSPSPLPSPRYNDKDHEFHHHQLRISISSTISLSLQKDDAADDEPPCMSSPIFNFNGDDTTNNNNNTNTSALMLNNPGVGLIMESNPYKPEAQTTIQRGTHHMDAPCSRKQPNFTTKTRSNGGMTKLLIKFRGINIGAILASLIKPLYQPNNNNNGHNKSSSKKYFQCYQKKLVNPTNTRRSNVKKDQGITRRSNNNNNNNNNNNWEFEDEIICGSFRSCKKSSRKLEMDLGAIRGIFNAMGMNIADKKGSRSKRRSQPNSCDTTPIHQGFSLYTNNNNNDNNNSIQAAIAYCKSSLGQTSDFSL